MKKTLFHRFGSFGSWMGYKSVIYHQPVCGYKVKALVKTEYHVLKKY